MAEANMQRDESIPDASTTSGDKRYVSARGPFTIWDAPAMNRAMEPPAYVDGAELVQPDGTDVLAEFDMSALAAKYGDAETRQKVYRMIEALVPGTSSTLLFSQPDVVGGMSLVHVWFGANLPLHRHSHAKFGDSLYCVLAGELLVGRRRLGPGAGIFVPNGQPYKYTSGPAGLEVLEFRAGGGQEGAADITIEEQSLDAIQKLTDQYRALQPQWKQPEKIGDTAQLQHELDFG